jgi:hypothetical protein
VRIVTWIRSLPNFAAQTKAAKFPAAFQAELILDRLGDRSDFLAEDVTALFRAVPAARIFKLFHKSSKLLASVHLRATRRAARPDAGCGLLDDHVPVIQRLAGLRTSPLARGFCGQVSSGCAPEEVRRARAAFAGSPQVEVCLGS